MNHRQTIPQFRVIFLDQRYIYKQLIIFYESRVLDGQLDNYNHKK